MKRRALRLPIAILVVLLFGIVGAVLFRVGASEKPRSVLLQWNPSLPKAGVTVTGYKIYRSQGDGSYQPIATVSAPPYVDHHVNNGETYHYFVTAVSAGGKESTSSNQASATIPNH
ncbi:MAG: fibronectin type III domain-containing protein [Terriglobales bacterium]